MRNNTTIITILTTIGLYFATTTASLAYLGQDALYNYDEYPGAAGEGSGAGLIILIIIGLLLYASR